MWAGTNSGHVSIFVLTVPAEDKRSKEKVTALLGKEIQLRHKAPVISIEVMDAAGGGVTDSPAMTSTLAPHR